MPKYQIILQGDEQLPSDEFHEYARRIFLGEPYKVIEARNLMGIRSEVWRQEPVSGVMETDISDLL